MILGTFLGPHRRWHGSPGASGLCPVSETWRHDLIVIADQVEGLWPAAPTGWATPAEAFLVDQRSLWLGQGPEVFHSAATRSRSMRIIGITALAVVVLGLMATTVAYLLISGSARTSDHWITVSPPVPAPRDVPPPHLPPVSTADALITPEGTDRGSRSFDGGLGVLELGSTVKLPSSILISLHANEVSDTVLKATTLPVGTTTVDIGMYAFALPDENKAITVARDIVTTEVRSGGGIEIAHAPAPRGVTVMRSVPGSNKPVYRAVYVLYDRVVFFEVLGEHRGDADAVLNTFTAPLDRQVMAHAPPAVRSGH